MKYFCGHCHTRKLSLLVMCSNCGKHPTKSVPSYSADTPRITAPLPFTPLKKPNGSEWYQFLHGPNAPDDYDHDKEAELA